MARISDLNKMKAVRKSLLEIIVRDGSSNASISKIAKNAGVSSGYIYIHYDSKESLLIDLYVEQFNNMNSLFVETINENETLEHFIFSFYKKVIDLADNNRNEMLFLLNMMTDYSIKLPQPIKEQVLSSLASFKLNFKDELNLNLTNEFIFTQIIGTILFFLNMRLRTLFTNENITIKELKSFSEIVIKSLQ